MTRADGNRSGSSSLTKTKLEVEKQFLKTKIFHGLKELRPWFDSPATVHFDARDFQVVVERCSRHVVTINGVEVFTHKGELLEVSFQDEGADSWCLDLIVKYQHVPRISFSATYSVPEDVD
jgi:hypothetical protein